MLGGKPTFQECDWLFWDWIHSALDYKNQYVVSLLGTVLVFAFLSEWGGCSLAPASFILQHNFKDITREPGGRHHDVSLQWVSHLSHLRWSKMLYVSLRNLKSNNTASFLISSLPVCEYTGLCECRLGAILSESNPRQMDLEGYLLA